MQIAELKGDKYRKGFKEISLKKGQDNKLDIRNTTTRIFKEQLL